MAGLGDLPSGPGGNVGRATLISSPESAFMNATTSADSCFVSFSGFMSLSSDGLAFAALIIVFDDVFKGLKASVVHVGTGASGVANGWGLERSIGRGVLGTDRLDHESAEVRELPGFAVPADAEVVELLVGEVEPDMAKRALRLLAKRRRS